MSLPFCNVDSFYRLDLNLPKEGISKICSYTCGPNFTLLNSANFGKIQTNLLMPFCHLKDGHERRFVLPPVSTRIHHTHTVEQPPVCLWHCCGIASIMLLSKKTYSEDTRAMLPHCPGYFITGVEQFFSVNNNFQEHAL